MKITEIRCPACGSSLSLSEPLPEFVTCEFCNGNLHLDQEKPPQIVQNINIYDSTYGKAGKNQGKIWLGVILTTSVLLCMVYSISNISSKDNSVSAQRIVPGYKAGSYLAEDQQKIHETTASPEIIDSEFIVEVSEKIFDKPISDITDAEFAKVKYVNLTRSSDGSVLQYSFDDPYTASEPSVKTTLISAQSRSVDDLSRFSGVVKLNLPGSMMADIDLETFTDLKGLSVGSAELSVIAAALPSPEKLVELSLNNTPSLNGIEAFASLESLAVENMADVDFKKLIPLNRLTSLTFIGDDENNRTDYTSIGALTSLETLHLEAPGVRDVGFLANLNKLKALHLEDTVAISIEPLTALDQLTRLSLSDNNKLADLTPVSSLINLQSLAIDKSTSQPDPNLTALTNLEELTISGFMTLTPIKNMTNVKNLTISGCNIDEYAVLASLTGVERFTMTAVWTYSNTLDNLNFLSGMSSLKAADFVGKGRLSNASGISGLGVYGDISSLFNHPGLEELYLDDGLFELDFSKIKENPTLKKLGMRNVRIVENSWVQSYGGMTNIGYDDIKFNEHLDLLLSFPNLEVLRLDQNEISDISFIANFKSLKELSLRDNYITDLSALIQLEQLTFLDVTDNPVGNVDFGEKVTVIR